MIGRSEVAIAEETRAVGFPEFAPSPAQIRQHCERIRQTWDQATLIKRNVYYSNWIVPMCREALKQERESWQR